MTGVETGCGSKAKKDHFQIVVQVHWNFGAGKKMSEVDIPSVVAQRAEASGGTANTDRDRLATSSAAAAMTTVFNSGKKGRKLRRQLERQGRCTPSTTAAGTTAMEAGGEGGVAMAVDAGALEAVKLGDEGGALSAFPPGSVGDGEFDFRPFFLIRGRAELYDRIAARCEEMVRGTHNPLQVLSLAVPHC